MEVVDDAHNAKIMQKVRAAREWWEKATRRQYINATWEWVLPYFPSADVFAVPKPPLSSITTIKYIDIAGDLQTLSDSVYDVDTHSDPGRIALAYNQSWPSTREDINAVTITLVAGYGTAPTDVPDDDRNAIMLLAGHWFEHREATHEGQLRQIPMGIKTLLSGSRILEV